MIIKPNSAKAGDNTVSVLYEKFATGYPRVTYTEPRVIICINVDRKVYANPNY